MGLVYIALGWTAGIILAANSSTRLPLIWLARAGLSLIVVALLWRGGRMAALCPLAFTLGGLRLALVSTTSAIAASRPDGMLHVWLLDVGGYNAVFAQTPGVRTTL
jgi:hypothetical protein